MRALSPLTFAVRAVPVLVVAVLPVLGVVELAVGVVGAVRGRFTGICGEQLEE